MKLSGLKKTKATDLRRLVKGLNRKSLVLQDEGHSISIRQMPENYRIAYVQKRLGCWVCEPDLGANIDLVFFIFELLLQYSIKWDRTGEKLKEAIANAIALTQMYYMNQIDSED
jgi:hypothetical protein